MGGFLGAIAGLGMLLLIGVLFFVFLYQAGAIHQKQVKHWGFAAGITLGMGMAYWLLGGLFYGVLFEPVAGIAEIQAIFRTRGLEKMYAALESPQLYGVLSGIFAWLGHGLGKILFEQYLFSGAVLAISMTLISVCLLVCSMEKIVGDAAAQKVAFLLLCLPGALFFFLPGWAPLALLLVSILFYFAGKKIPSSAWRMPESLYSWLIGIAGMLSAAVVLGTVMGNWG